MRASASAVAGCLASALVAAPAGASPAPPRPALDADAHVDFAAQPPDAEQPSAPDPAPAGDAAGAGAEAPPPRPRRKGLVLESTAGVLGFAGQFRHVAPPSYWMHAQLGYEWTSWLMTFGEGELALSQTSEAQDESSSRAFPMWGFGGGARLTARASERVSLFLQGDVGALTALVPRGALAELGFPKAESLGLELGGRLGVEWHHADPHIALCFEAGARDATGFAKLDALREVPIMWDGSGGIRYTF